MKTVTEKVMPPVSSRDEERLAIALAAVEIEYANLNTATRIAFDQLQRDLAEIEGLEVRVGERNLTVEDHPLAWTETVTPSLVEEGHTQRITSSLFTCQETYQTATQPVLGRIAKLEEEVNVLAHPMLAETSVAELTSRDPAARLHTYFVIHDQQFHRYEIDMTTGEIMQTAAPQPFNERIFLAEERPPRSSYLVEHKSPVIQPHMMLKSAYDLIAGMVIKPKTRKLPQPSRK